MRVARTFAFVDLSGFTQFTDLHGDDEAVAVLSQFRAALRATASDIGVRVAKWLGDGAMLVSVDTTSLVEATVSLADQFADDGLLPLRAGLAAGKVILFEGDDYTGGAINLAARLCDLAQPLEVLATADIGELVPDGIAAIDAGRVRRRRPRPSGRRRAARARVALRGHGRDAAARATPSVAGAMRTDWNTLRLERDGHVGRLVLNRPDKLNSFTIEMWRELRELGQALVADPDGLRALVVIGAGRAFSSGIDTTVFTGGEPGRHRRRSRRRHPARRPVGRRHHAHAGVVLVARDRAVRHDRRGARLRARRRAADRARVRHPRLRARRERRAARAQVRDHPGPRRHATAARGSSGRARRRR